MPIYEMRLEGRRKPVLLNSESAARAKDTLVQAKALTRAEVSDAFIAGEAIWNPGTPLPADDPEPEAERESEQAGDQIKKPGKAGDAAS